MHTGKKNPAVLFVCTANICRSPMAAALFRAQLERKRDDWQDWRVDSAGTWGLDGEKAAKNSQLVMEKRGLDLSTHRARTVDAAMLAEYDLILTMEAGHKEALGVEFPEVVDRVFLLSEMEGSSNPIEDPIGKTVDAYEETAKKMDGIIERGFLKIVALVVRRAGRQE